jgi:exosortase/archaeosortase family protein
MKFLNLAFEKEDAVKTGRFLLYFILVYLALSFVAQAVVGMEAIELWVAGNVLGMLNMFGFAGTVSFEETALVSLEAGSVIQISELCTGTMELFIVVGAIIASLGISWRRRLIGTGAAGIAVILFNHVRIVFTSLLILGTGDLALIDFTHNVLFRVFLFVTVAGLYIAWFYWAASKEMPVKKACRTK